MLPLLPFSKDTGFVCTGQAAISLHFKGSHLHGAHQLGAATNMLLFSDIHRVDPVSFRSFHEDRSLRKHNIEMGLPEGHSVLLHFSHNERAYQAVLVSMSSASSKSKKGEHAMWKHVLPVSTDFAWLPDDVADAFCSLALHQDSTRPYGSFHEIQLGFNEHYQASLHIEGLYYLGETCQMPAERLCLGCGVQSDERFSLMPPQDRGKLFAATIRLMQLVLTSRPLDATDDEEQIRQALQPLVQPFPCYPLSATVILA